jgi:hypothetical protein
LDRHRRDAEEVRELASGWSCAPASNSPVRIAARMGANCAGRCLRCGERDCEAPECIEWHEASHWMICPRCDGEEWSWNYERCGCIFGVVEAWPPGHPGLSITV